MEKLLNPLLTEAQHKITFEINLFTATTVHCFLGATKSNPLSTLGYVRDQGRKNWTSKLDGASTGQDCPLSDLSNDTYHCLSSFLPLLEGKARERGRKKTKGKETHLQ